MRSEWHPHCPQTGERTGYQPTATQNAKPASNKISLPTFDIATYSACVVDRVAHFCVLERDKVPPPARITSPLHTELPSVNRLAYEACVRKRNHAKSLYCTFLKVNPKKNYQSLLNTLKYQLIQSINCCIPVDQLGCIACSTCYGPHRIDYVRPAQQSNPQQCPNQLSKRSVYVGLADIKLPKPAHSRSSSHAKAAKK